MIILYRLYVHILTLKYLESHSLRKRHVEHFGADYCICCMYFKPIDLYPKFKDFLKRSNMAFDSISG